MKKIPAISRFMALGLICAMLALSPSSAETPALLKVNPPPAVPNVRITASVHSRVEFVPAASYKVEHQPMTITLADSTAAQGHIVTREAYLTIGGMQGETVLVSCNVSSTQNAHRNIRDCGGQPSVEQHAVMSGQKLDDGVLLTDDLMPNGKDKSDSTVTFEVSYF